MSGAPVTPSDTHVAVDGGKYTVVIVGDGGLHALRYGQPWRDLCGDNLVFNLAWELNEARSDLAALRASHAEMRSLLSEMRDFYAEILDDTPADREFAERMDAVIRNAEALT